MRGAIAAKSNIPIAVVLLLHSGKEQPNHSEGRPQADQFDKDSAGLGLVGEAVLSIAPCIIGCGQWRAPPGGYPPI